MPLRNELVLLIRCVNSLYLLLNDILSLLLSSSTETYLHLQ
jgi:hypothetical protein